MRPRPRSRCCHPRRRARAAAGRVHRRGPRPPRPDAEIPHGPGRGRSGATALRQTPWSGAAPCRTLPGLCPFGAESSAGGCLPGPLPSGRSGSRRPCGRDAGRAGGPGRSPGPSGPDPTGSTPRHLCASLEVGPFPALPHAGGPARAFGPPRRTGKTLPQSDGAAAPPAERPSQGPRDGSVRGSEPLRAPGLRRRACSAPDFAKLLSDP
jgi:hypothetical protein